MHVMRRIPTLRRPVVTTFNHRLSISRRRLVAGATFVLALTAVGSIAHAQTSFPNRPITLLVPAPPGGAGDTSARAIARHMSETLKQQIVVENKPGAAATIGLRALASSTPDGYTFGLVPVAGTAIATVTYKDLPDIRKDFVTIAGIADAPHVLVVPSTLQVKRVEELVATFKANPGKHNYASQGSGSLSHLESAVFIDAADVEVEHIPYKGSSEAIPGLINGDTSMMFDSVASALPHITAGRLVPLATAATRRVPQLPDVPTTSELGYDLQADNAFVLLAAAGTPPENAKILTDAVEAALKDETVISTLATTGIVARFTAPDEFQATIDHDFSVWPKLVRELTPAESAGKQ